MNIFIDSYIIYMYTMYKVERRSTQIGPSAPCLALAMKSLPVDYARHDRQARTHIFTVRDNERGGKKKE